MILVHGRGATAQSILELGQALDHPDFAYMAPQAADNTWYPYSFLSPLQRNEPGLSSGLEVIGGLVERAIDAGIEPDRIVIGGFSQGAWLAAEFVARNARRYGGLLVFSGGLIGPVGTERRYSGSLEGAPVFIGCSDREATADPAEIAAVRCVNRDQLDEWIARDRDSFTPWFLLEWEELRSRHWEAVERCVSE